MTRLGSRALALLALAALAAPASAAPPRRVVSLNLCTDQLVLVLADRAQIAGLTRNARDRDMSAEAEKAGGLRLLGSSAEEIIGIRPDLVVGMPASGSPALAMLGPRSPRTLDLGMANRLEDIFVAIRRTAAAVGHADRGEALIAAMRRDLAGVPRAGRGRVAAYYQRRGYLTGTGTLVDDAMARVGLVNLGSRLGKSALAQVSVEEIVAARPDYLIVESATDRVTDQGTEMLHHPALRHIPRLVLPQAWTVCGGPAYVRAVRALADQLAGKR
jgi:iron complex transport system substrate-binding protein